jgi:ADP-heptose:LPS heptosyltransferase
LKFLLLRLRRTGDIVLTTPAVSALRAAFPASELTYVVEEPYARLVQGHPCLDKVIVLEPKMGWRAFWRLIRKIRREKYDVILDFHSGPRSSILTLFSGAKTKVGYEVKYRRFIYGTRVPRASSQGPVHSAANHLNLVKALGVAIPEPPPLLLPKARPEEADRTEKLLAGSGRAVILHIGAGNEFRNWGVQNIAELLGLFDSRPDIRVYLAGGPDDLPAEAEIRELHSRPVRSLVGQLNLIELREAISRAALFIGPDSGPMHIAASTQTPIVAYFGPTLPVHFAPWKSRVTVLEKRLECRPCHQRRCLYKDFRCLKTITPQEVFSACREYIH